MLSQGTYDFRVVMEDDDYSYDVVLESIYVNTDLNLNVCVDCNANKSNVKIIKIPKLNKKGK